MTRRVEDYFAQRAERNQEFASACRETEADYKVERSHVQAQIADRRQRDWILLALRKGALDRIHLMKVMFLVWYRGGKGTPGFFAEFKPYFYGPCSTEVYQALDELMQCNLVLQDQHPSSTWGRYRLTRSGRELADKLAGEPRSGIVTLLDDVANEVGPLDFKELLRRVYREAPEYATQTLVRSALPQ